MQGIYIYRLTIYIYYMGSGLNFILHCPSRVGTISQCVPSCEPGYSDFKASGFGGTGS